MYAPPPPPVQKKQTNWMPILVVLGVGFVILAGLCGFGIYSISKLVKEPPKEMAGAKRPVLVKSHGDGWARYRFAEGLFEADLPGRPEFSDPGMERFHNLSIRDWLYYDIESENAYLSLSVYNYRSREFVDLKEELGEIQASLRNDKDVTELKSSDYKKTVDGKEGWETTCKYKFKGEDAVLKAFTWAKGNAVYYIQTYHHPDLDKEADEGFYRVITSVAIN